jgi:hypothetical protein
MLGVEYGSLMPFFQSPQSLAELREVLLPEEFDF